MPSAKCPECERFLRKQTVAEADIRVCPDGHGAWLLPDAMHTLSHENLRGSPLDLDTGLTRADSSRHGRRPCPACGALMQEYQWNWGSHIFLDTCSACRGIWADRGELVMMQRYLKEMDKTIELHPILAAKLRAARAGPPEQTPVEKVYDILDKALWVLIRFLP